MLTDPFTTADDRWDESPHHLADHCEHAGVGKACRRCRRKFDAASQWARTHLAAQEPTDAEVEAVAVLLYRQRALHHTMESWGREPEPVKNRHRLDARAALVAARDARTPRRDEATR